MRIAMLCTDLGIRVPDESKGASIHLVSVARAFRRAGHDVLLIGVAGHGQPPHELECHLLPHPGRSQGLERERRKLAFVERVVAEAAAPLESFEPDVLYERLSLFGTAGRRLALALGVGHAVEVNALLAREEAVWRGLHLAALARRLERFVLETADVTFAVSEELRAQILEIAPATRVSVVENGVETSRFATLEDAHTARRRLGLPPAARIVVFVGALRPWHGVDVALSALTRLPEDIHFAVVGDGPARPSLEACATAAGVSSRVHWLGQLPHSEIPTALAAADVAVAPYPPLEHFAFSPLKLFEYQAAGIPVVASDIGQIRALLGGGRYGLLVAPGDADALARGVLEAFLPSAQAGAALARKHALRAHGWDSRVELITSVLAASSSIPKAHVVAC